VTEYRIQVLEGLHMSNVDHAEIAKFEALAHRWWDRNSEFKAAFSVKPWRCAARQ
jgi:2-polyprenyl-6-hydroxyphenyl methylase/3-demethylubiquinone-9 3-methyltransferase